VESMAALPSEVRENQQSKISFQVLWLASRYLRSHLTCMALMCHLNTESLETERDLREAGRETRMFHHQGVCQPAKTTAKWLPGSHTLGRRRARSARARRRGAGVRQTANAAKHTPL
jgi:hypothetical protein